MATSGGVPGPSSARLESGIGTMARFGGACSWTDVRGDLATGKTARPGEGTAGEEADKEGKEVVVVGGSGCT